jgi:hypothetical protein
VIWEPFLLALVLGLVVSAGLYFAYLWPSVEPLEEEAVAAAGASAAAAVATTAAEPEAATAEPEAATEPEAPAAATEAPAEDATGAPTETAAP